MQDYKLLADEVLLFNSSSDQRELLLTNLNLVFITRVKKLFAKEQVCVETVPTKNIKIYNDDPQIKQNDCQVEIFLVEGECDFTFATKQEARKFINAVRELLTGKTSGVRRAEIIREKVDRIGDAIGANPINLAAGIVGGAVGGGIGKALINSVKDSVFAKSSGDGTQQSISESSSASSYENQTEALKQMKELLDDGIITQEEFDAKKKEILGI